jgi:hypothetical protein
MQYIILFRYRQSIANVTLAGLETKGRWVFNPVSTRSKKSPYVFSTTYSYVRLPIGPCNSLKLRLYSHS